MSEPHFHRLRRTFTASRAVEVQGSALSDIKREDDATFKDVGRVLGKSEDRAAVYAGGVSAMDLPTFLAGCDAWGGRFADPLLALAGGRWADLGSVCTGDEKAALPIATLLTAVIAIEADGMTEADELRPHGALIRKVHQLTSGWLALMAGGQ